MSDNFIMTMIETSILNFLYETLKKGISTLLKNHPIQKTIERLVEKYTDIENLSATLESWLKNESVKHTIEQYTKGKSRLDIEELAKILIVDGKFFLGEEIDTKSLAIIKEFFTILNEEFLKEDGLLYLDYKEEERNRKVLEEVGEVKEIVKKLSTQHYSPISGAPLISEVVEKYKSQYTKRIDEAKLLLLEGKVDVAKNLYETLLSNLSKEEEPYERLNFRVYTNLGCCEIELGNNNNAVLCFERAHQIDPNDLIGLANIAVAKKLRGEMTEALQYIDKLLSSSPKNKLGICIKSSLFIDERKYNEAINIFKSKPGDGFDDELMKDAQCCFSLGNIFFEKKNYSKARKYFELACTIEKKNSDYYLLLGLSYCMDLLRKKEFPWLYTERSKQRLKKAEKNITKAYDILKNQEKLKKLELVLINRSAVQLALQNFQGAIKDCKIVLENNPNNFLAIKNKAISEGLSGNFDKTIQTLEPSLEDVTNQYETIPMMVYAYLNKVPPEPDKAIDLITRFFLDEKISKKNFMIKIDLATCYISKSEFKKAEELIKEIREYSPISYKLFHLLFRYYEKINEIKKAENYILKALEKTKGIEFKILSLELANFYNRNKFYDKAIPIYERIVNLQVNNLILRSYLICLYYSTNKKKNHPKILNICKTIRKIDGITKFVTEIEASVLENTFDRLQDASNLYFELSKIEPEKLHHRLRYSIVEFRLGNETVALNTINQIKDSYEGNADDLMTMAEILHHIGDIVEAIKLGYKALKQAPQDPRINIAYIHIFITSEIAESNVFLNPEKIDKNTAVKLSINGDEKEITIIDMKESPRNISEVSVDSDIGQKILNLKVDDKVSLGDPSYTRQTIKVKEIKSVYVKAFQDSIQNFGFLFPKEKGLKSIKADKNLKNILELVDERVERTSHFTQLYMQNRFTIGFLSNILGVTLFDTWAGLVYSSNAKLICSNGNIQTIHKELNALEKSESVILDLIGLFTIAHLQITSMIPKIFKKIYISQSCLDEINHILATQSIAKEKGYITVGKHKDKYVKREVTPKEIEFNINHLNKIKEFVLSDLDIVGLESPIVETKFKLVRALGRPSYDSINIAKEKGLGLYSDDFFLRELARNEDNVDSFSIQPLLMRAKDLNVIDNEEYFKKIIELVLSDYSIISINADVLYYSAVNSCFNYHSSEFLKLLETIQDPNITLQSAIGVLTNFLKEVYLSTIPDGDKRMYLDLCLNTLTKSRNVLRAVRLLKKGILSNFRYIPDKQEKVFRFIDSWIRTKIILI